MASAVCPEGREIVGIAAAEEKRKRRAAFSAELNGIWIAGLAFRTFDTHCSALGCCEKRIKLGSQSQSEYFIC
jgi:hypothetical protein